MYASAKIKWKQLAASILIALGTGGISALFVRDDFKNYEMFEKPALSPPQFLFPIVWAILFFLMGVSAYMIYNSENQNKKTALTVYGIQLAVNFLWPILFFKAKLFFISFLWLILLWALVALMILLFRKIRPIAAYIQIPYLLWLTFAGYLNFMVYKLNG